MASVLRKGVAGLLFVTLLMAACVLAVSPAQPAFAADEAVSPVQLTGYETYTDHDGEANNTKTDDMRFHITAHFNDKIAIADAEKLLSELSIVLNFNLTLTAGTPDPNNMARYAEIAVGEDGKSLLFTLHLGFAPFSGNVNITAPNGLTQLTDAKGRPIVWQDINFFMSNGVKLLTLSQTAGLPSKNIAASVVKEVVAPATSIRGMIHMLFLKNGQPVGAVNNYGASIICHYHDYLNLNAEKFAAMIPGWFKTKYGIDYSMEINGDEVTVTEKRSAKGNVIDLRIFGYPQDRDTQADKTALNAAITKASAYDSTQYTPETYHAMRNELYIAQALAASPYYLQTEIDAQALKLQQACDSLVPGAGEADDDTVQFTTQAAAGYFEDVPGDYWAADSINYLAEIGVVHGKGEKVYAPDDEITRAEVVTMLGIIADIDPQKYTAGSFTDLEAGAWYIPYANWAAEAGIISAADEGIFAPRETVSREELAVLLHNFTKVCPIFASNAAVTIADEEEISEPAGRSVSYIVASGIIILDSEELFRPAEIVNRAQAADILIRYIALQNTGF